MSGEVDNYYVVPTNEKEAPIQMCFIEEVRDYVKSHTDFDRYNIYDKTVDTLYTPQNEVIWYGASSNPNGEIKLSL